MLRQSAIVVTMLLLTLPAKSQDFEKGFSWFRGGEYQEALREFRILAQQSNPAAQFMIGHMYVNGFGVPPSDAEAANWFAKSSKGGLRVAGTKLANLYLTGPKMMRNAKAAAKLYHDSAREIGDAEALIALSNLYQSGHGVETVPRQHKLDRIGRLNKRVFLAHRSDVRSADETKTRRQSGQR